MIQDHALVISSIKTAYSMSLFSTFFKVFLEKSDFFFLENILPDVLQQFRLIHLKFKKIKFVLFIWLRNKILPDYFNFAYEIYLFYI